MKPIWVIGGMVAVLVAEAVSAEAALRQAQISSVSGRAEWLQAGSDTWQAAAVNQPLFSGDKIRTGQDGAAVLSLDEGSTIELSAESEFAIQMFATDPVTQDLTSILGISKGSLKAVVPPVPAGSIFQIQTPIGTVQVPAGGLDPALTITINPDGSVAVGSLDGEIEFFTEGEHATRVILSSGDVALLAIDPATGTLTVTSLAGTFDVIGPDGTTTTLASGDVISYDGGAATFVPAPPILDAPAADALAEPVT